MDRTANKKCRVLDVNAKVLIRNYAGDKSKWIEGKVLQKLGMCHYQVMAQDGSIMKRHVDQLLQLPSYTTENFAAHENVVETDVVETDIVSHGDIVNGPSDIVDDASSTSRDSVQASLPVGSSTVADVVTTDTVVAAAEESSQKRYPDRTRKPPS